MVDMDPEDKKRHEWAAKGLAYTCYVSYVDQTSGLGPDVLLMKKGRKWVDVLRNWEESRKSRLEEASSAPPGLGEPRRERIKAPDQKIAKRDYANLYKAYKLRPEVSGLLFFSIALEGLIVRLVDGRKSVLSVENDRRRTVARARVGDICSCRRAVQDKVWVCDRVIGGR